jgi:hypothetical protein
VQTSAEAARNEVMCSRIAVCREHLLNTAEFDKLAQIMKPAKSVTRAACCRLCVTMMIV